MGQTKSKSFLESVANTLVGMVITMLVSPAIYWMCGVKMHYNQMILATILFTLISILRNYLIRRWFNKKM
jgi:predicted Na+-dependent transporter